MVNRCNRESINVYLNSESTRQIARRFNCSNLQAALLEMRGITADSPQHKVDEWLSPYLPRLLEKLDLGCPFNDAADLIRKLGTSSSVVVYGDYDVDGISSTAIAMELVMTKGAHVRYYIPHRFNDGYGFHNQIAALIAKRRCDLVIVVDCGTHDVDAVETLKSYGIPVIIFDHHLVEGTPVKNRTIINPQISGDSAAKKLCATGVIWTWIWQNQLLPDKQLLKMLDVVALATIADCVSLTSPLNRALIKGGLNSLRFNTRAGLNILMNQMGITASAVDTEDLAMKIIPCLNAAGRLYLADLAVNILFQNKDLPSNVQKLIELNKRRRELSAKILEQVELKQDDGFRYVLTNSEWSVGVLSSVASRICCDRNMPVAMAASVKGVMRGTLRMPQGGNAVGLLKTLAPMLNTWGGHRLAAGFSVKEENWNELRKVMESKLSEFKAPEEKEDLLYWQPCNLDVQKWEDVMRLGPFGMENASPLLFFPYDGTMTIEPLGKVGKHIRINTSSVSLLAFGAADMFVKRENIYGWGYRPRIDRWRKITSLQFVLEKIIV